MKTKTCTRCNRTLPISEFGKHKLGIDGLNYWCRTCNRERYQEYSKTGSGIYTALKARIKFFRNKPLTITREEFIEWYDAQEKRCVYCDLTEKDLSKVIDSFIEFTHRLSIDSVDNDKGYVKGNLVLACNRCNTMKSNFLTFDEMKEIGQKYFKPKWQKTLREHKGRVEVS